MSALDIFMAGFEREIEAYRGLDEAQGFRKLAAAAIDEFREPGSRMSILDALVAAAKSGSLEAAAGLHVLSLSDPSAASAAKRALFDVASRSPEVREELVVDGLTTLIEPECERQGMIREEGPGGKVTYRKPGGAA